MPQTREPKPVVLYVDDDVHNTRTFQFAFGREFQVEVCNDPGLALDRLRRGDVSVLITDQRMPNMSGLELLRAARELSPETAGVVVTAYADAEPLTEALNEHLVEAWVSKPWNHDELASIIKKAMEHRQRTLSPQGVCEETEQALCEAEAAVARLERTV